MYAYLRLCGLEFTLYDIYTIFRPLVQEAGKEASVGIIAGQEGKQ